MYSLSNIDRLGSPEERLHLYPPLLHPPARCGTFVNMVHVLCSWCGGGWGGWGVGGGVTLRDR